MNIGFALEYIASRMRELKFDENYYIRFRHLQLDPSEERIINAFNHYFILIDPDEEIKVKSKLGEFDLEDTAINEMQHEHKGRIYVINKTPKSKLVQFIQVIPQYKNQ